MTQDYYALLQVERDADLETIQAAYKHQMQRYDATQLEDAADELQALARERRDALGRALAVLSDPVRRARYDEEAEGHAALAALANTEDVDDEQLDYRPLPPAQGQERPRTFTPQPVRPVATRPATGRRAQAGRKPLPLWVWPSVTVGVLSFVVMLTSLLLTNGGQPRYASEGAAPVAAPAAAANAVQEQQAAAPNAPQDEDALLAEYDGQIVAARQVVAQVPDNANAWIQLGNALYDSVQVVREMNPDSAAYAERLPRWLEASEAYQQALDLDPNNPLVLSERGVTLCYYGDGSGEQSYIADGLGYTQQAAEAVRDNGRVLLNHGVCLASDAPPQTEAALAVWNEVLGLPTAELGVARQAQILIERYTP